MSDNLELFNFPKFKITQKIRLIELFGGIGSQAMALRDIGAYFEHYRLVEFDKYAVLSYNAIHGTQFETSDIKNVHGADLGITEKDKYCYLMTYSFPCQDLSVAGKQQGMKKGGNTRSGLLWEVERILNELNQEDLPQVLLMENVSQVHAEKNMLDYETWLSFLCSKGYYNFWKDLNAKDYGIPQSRKRCFCVSILSASFVNYQFPETIKLRKVMKDFLEKDVAEKYYIDTEKSKKLIEQLIKDGIIGTRNMEQETKNCIPIDLSINKPKAITIANCISAKTDRGISNKQSEGSGVVEQETVLLSKKGSKFEKKTDIAICLMARDYKGFGTYSFNSVIHNYRIRKLTPRECWRLMGYSDSDFDKAQKVNSNTQLYRQAGNAIVKQVLMAIFKQMGA